MRRYARALSCPPLAALAIGGATACSFGLGDPGTVNLQAPRVPATDSQSSGNPEAVIVHPARVPAVGGSGQECDRRNFLRPLLTKSHRCNAKATRRACQADH